jgi:hypothetical protein
MEAISFFLFTPSSTSEFAEKDLADSLTATYLISTARNQTGMADTPKFLVILGMHNINFQN